MFYRASEMSEGSGLGLYIVKNTIQKLKGSINVTSVEGQGTTFSVVIPNYPEPPQDPEEGPAAPGEVHGGGGAHAYPCGHSGRRCGPAARAFATEHASRGCAR